MEKHEQTVQMETLKVQDVIDINFLQKFQDLFSGATGMASISVDLEGPITEPSNFTDFCIKYTRGSEEGMRRCVACDLMSGEKSKATGKPAIYYCHAGLIDFAVPIVVDNQHIGSVLGGQVLPAKPDEEKFRKIAAEIGVDPDEYIEALRKIKIVPEEQINQAAEMLFLTVNQVTENHTNMKKLVEAEKEKSRIDIAEASNKAKSDFLATMSHEIRTPLNAILGISQIQMQKEDLPDDYSDALNKIFISSNTLLGIINDILDMSKIESGKLEIICAEYDVPSLINDVVQLNVVRIGSKQVEVLLDIDENLPSILIGDELRLKQILNNLLSNGIKYTEKGYVKLSVSHSKKGEDILLRFAVEDTGQGLKPEDQEKLFTEYTRFNIGTNRTTEGTGLGLNITMKLVEMMGGTIKVQSEYGKGSTFIVEVKQQPVECSVIGRELAERLRNFTFSVEAQMSKMQINRYPMPYGKVLVVDDVDTNLYVAEGLLAAYKLNVETADSGFAAISKVESGNTYDVIFMDHMMPKMDGIQTTHKLREMGYKDTIVALTANALVGNDEMFKQNGFDGFIAKPIDLQQLDAALNTFIRGRYPEEAEKYKAQKADSTGAPKATAKMLSVFRRDAEKAAITLRQTAAAGDIKLFTTTAHAMKSALANVGKGGQSQQAAALEKAGLNGGWDFITANTEDFVKALEEIIKELAPASSAGGGDNNNDIAEDTAYLTEQLEIIAAACEDYDVTAAYAALDCLKEKTWKAETSAMLEEIRDTLYLHSDFDEAAEKAGLLIKNRENKREQVTIRKSLTEEDE